VTPRAWYSQDGTRLIEPLDYRPSLHGPGTGYVCKPARRGLTDGQRLAVQLAGWLALALVLAVLLFGPGLVGA
jgi:hypothetical protein